jgi:hypothetical protein
MPNTPSRRSGKVVSVVFDVRIELRPDTGDNARH